MSILLQDLVTRQALLRPSATAVMGRGEVLSYGALEDWSSRLAWVLHRVGCAREDRVCLLMPKTPRAIGAMLAVLKVGGMYVPLDPDCPASQLAKVIESCGSNVLLAAGSHQALVDQLRVMVPAGTTVVGWLDERPFDGSATVTFDGPDVARAPAVAPGARVYPSDGAHILFTSAPAGRPEGVVVRHSSVLHFVRWAVQYFETGHEDHVSGQLPMHASVSAFDIYGSFAAGAALHLVPEEVERRPLRLAQWMRTSALTQWFSPPSVLLSLLHAGAVTRDDFPTLRHVLWWGAAMPTADLRRLMDLLPHPRFTSLYGPTETTIASGYYTVSERPASDDAVLPVGRACPGESLLVLNQELRPVAVGETGELYIRGVGLSPGYWRDSRKTRAGFLTDPRSRDPYDRIYRTGELGLLGEDGLVYLRSGAASPIEHRNAPVVGKREIRTPAFL